MWPFWWTFYGFHDFTVYWVEFDDPVKFSEFHNSNKYDIHYMSVMTEKCVEIHYKHQLQDDPMSPNLHIFIACFMTCWAR